jgi:hypothetical protein
MKEQYERGFKQKRGKENERNGIGTGVWRPPFARCKMASFVGRGLEGLVAVAFGAR